MRLEETNQEENVDHVFQKQVEDDELMKKSKITYYIFHLQHVCHTNVFVSRFSDSEQHWQTILLLVTFIENFLYARFCSKHFIILIHFFFMTNIWDRTLLLLLF